MKEEYDLHKEGDFYVTEVPSGSGKFFGFKKWNWGDKNALSAQCTMVDPMTGFINFDSIKFNEELIARTVFKKEEDKFVPIKGEEARAFDAQLGERLFQITQKLNLVTNIEAKNL